MSYEQEACCPTHAIMAPPMTWAGVLEEPPRGYFSRLVTRYTMTDLPMERDGSIERLCFSPLSHLPPYVLPTYKGIVSKPVQKPVGKLTLVQGISQVLSYRKTA